MSDQVPHLPDDVREAIAPHLPETRAVLEAIGVEIARKRDEAKAARLSSGIETTWKECEEAYVGIDDANRQDFQNARWAKPMSSDGPVTTGRAPETGHRSTVYVRLTARYVDAGAAKLAEILLPPDDKAFGFDAMPVPELIDAKADQSQVVHETAGPLTRPAQPGEAGLPLAAPNATQAAPPGRQPAPQVPLTVADLALENIELARKSAKKAETRVYDWLIASRYRAELRKVIFDSARIGVGVLKAPFPKMQRQIALRSGTKPAQPGGDASQPPSGPAQLMIREKLIPGAAWVDAWNIFPDPACGENIHEGDYVFERDHMSPRQVRKLKALPGYISDQIDEVLKEGPQKANVDGDSGAGGVPDERRSRGRYEVWYFYGALKRDEMQALQEAAGVPTPDATDQDQIYAIVTLINDRPVRAVLNPLDSGSFPYHSVPWQRRSGHWAGVGIAEQIKAPQRITNAAVRAMLNNAGKASGSQIVVDPSRIRPSDDSWTITPDKVWLAQGDGVGTDVRQAFQVIEIPSVTAQLMTIIQFGMQLGEESTSIPLVTQGQSGETTPQTFGAAQLQNNNANQLLRDIALTFDDCITEPVVNQYYEWLLLDPDVPDDEKAEYQIDAHGSMALVERAIQDQTIAQMGPLVVNPAYKSDPSKWFAQFLRSKHLDPQDFQYTPEQQQKIDQQPPPEPWQITVARIDADTAMKQLAAKQSADQQDIASEERIAAAAHALEGGKQQIDQARVATDATVRLHELAMRREAALLDYANRHQISLDQAKTALARTAMTLQTQRDLNAQDNAADMARKPERPRRGMQPPAQVPGRAGNGRAFEQGPS